MGNGVRPASKSTIEIRFYLDGIRCEERVKMPPTSSNIKFCENWKKRIDHEIATNTFDYKSHFPNSKNIALFSRYKGDAILISEYLDSWLKESKDYLMSSTYNGYRKIIKGHLSPVFGHLKLTDFSRKHAKEWMRDNPDMSSKTISNVISPLRIALDDALEDELINANPLAGWKVKRKRGRSRKADAIDPFSYQETQQILAAMNEPDVNMFEFWFNTGLRVSELVALDWGDIDWGGRKIRIDKALTMAADETEQTKTDAGDRDVWLNERALQALERQRAHTLLKGNEIFQNTRTGERWTGDAPIRLGVWAKALKKAKVRYRYPYQIRHTRISNLLMAGENPMWVATQVGHTDWAFTARTYSRFIPDNAPDAGSKEQEAYMKGVESGDRNATGQ